ncbi:hypothetical protein EES43_15205 [Streptomyces sp. ADI96-02]|nr:hypothetical protein EES43_15205 [Streptomyces sp. ADI96-02]
MGRSGQVSKSKATSQPARLGPDGSANPLWYLRRADTAGWFDNYAQSFEAVWAIARYNDPEAPKANTLIPANNLLVVDDSGAIPLHPSMRQQIGDYLAGTYPYLG